MSAKKSSTPPRSTAKRSSARKASVSPDYWLTATKALSNADPVMKKIITQYKGETLTPKGDAFFTLARAIAGQQISVKAADTIWRRLEEAVGMIKPKHMHAAEDAILRAAGLSGQKVKYMRALTEHFLQNPKADAHIKSLPDEAVIKELVALPGIGKWTAEMFLIFHLARPDVFPIADIGLQKAIRLHYDESLSLDAMQKLSERWKPWRSVATWYLWRSLDPVPVEY